MSIFERFKVQALLHKNKTALIIDNFHISYTGLLGLVEENMYLARRIPVGIPVAAPLDNDLGAVMMLLTFSAVGNALIPVPPNTSERVCKDLTARSFNAPENTFLALSTSGTTGPSKAIHLSQAAKLARVMQISEMFDIQAEDVLLVGTPLHHSLGQRMLFTALTKGCTAVMPPRYSPTLWNAAAVQCSLVVGLPHQLKHLDVFTAHKLRCVVSSSSPRSGDKQLINDLGDADIPYYDTYGASEIAFATYGLVTEHTLLSTVGMPAPGVARIDIDPDTGEMIVLSITGSGAWFRTGDAGERLPDGQIRLLGRTNDRIKVGGFTVWPEDVDAAIAAHSTLECATFRAADPTLGEHVGLALTDASLSLRDVQRNLANVLTAEQMPRSVKYVAEIPRTATGKIKRKELADD